jgi:hypothetical protein
MGYIRPAALVHSSTITEGQRRFPFSQKPAVSRYHCSTVSLDGDLIHWAMEPCGEKGTETGPLGMVWLFKP